MAEKPIHKISVGAIQVAVWENQGKEGNVFNSVSLQKTYKQGEEWKKTSNLKQNDLPKAVLALQKAFEYLSLKESTQESS
jgi:hypothetical protein